MNIEEVKKLRDKAEKDTLDILEKLIYDTGCDVGMEYSPLARLSNMPDTYGRKVTISILI